ncbi:XrtA/PEP-CTERM system TPR-repeat protein PrsT [Paremcibacter congregatus]|uniref:XrtA/PEP-CTERM system TPR-repeat protein PrsT n=1 Tax=Paremcibacter congregatus TaxID=2043170 RepID=UPI0030EED787|tara:strand:+ start:41351 stop:44275 length:2925 start_codon:yes stop_codon:yes gene_type:complete
MGQHIIFLARNKIASHTIKAALYSGWRTIKASHKILALLVALCLTACSEEEIKTENAYLDGAYEAHTTGNSRRALFELATAIRHYPKNAELQVTRGNIFLDLEDGAAAEIAYNKAVSLGYNKEFLKHKLAESWLYQRKPGKVISEFESELLQGSENALMFEVVGRAYIATRDRTNPALFIKNMDNAENYINEALRLSPQNTRVLITKAWLTALSGKLEEALDWLAQADEIVKDQRQNLSVKGELLIRQDKLDEANKVYSRLVEKFPQYPQYKMELGYTHLLKGELEIARKWISPITQQYPDHLRAKTLLANISLMEKKYDEAKTLSDAVLAKSSENLDAILVNGASSYFLDDLENAHQKLSNFYSKTGSIPSLKLLAATKLKLGEAESAAQLLADAGQTSTSQTDSEMLNLVALASAKIGKVDVALEAYQKLAAERPNSSSFLKNTALLQIAQGNYEEGFKNLEEALSKETEEKEPGQDLYYLVSKALQVRQLDRAASYIEQYKATTPDSYKPWTMSAVLNSILKKTDAVHADFARAIEVAPNVAEVRARYAIFQKMSGNNEKAEALARQALELDPSDIGAGKLILEDLIKEKKYSEVKIIVDNAINAPDAAPENKLLFSDYYNTLGRPQDTLKVLDDMPRNLKSTGIYQLIASKAYLRSGQAQRAVETLERVTIKAPNNIPAMKYLLRGYLLTKDQAKYQATLEKLDRLLPNDYENQLELAKLYISTGRYKQAEKTLNIIRPGSEEDAVKVSILKAGLKTNVGDPKSAIDILEPIYRQYPDNGMINMLYARNLAQNNQADLAISVTKTWAEQHEDNAESKQFLGDLYLHKKDMANAKAQYNLLITVTEKPKLLLHAHNNLANIYLGEGENDQALMHAQKAYDMAPNIPEVVDTFAQVLMKQGQAARAIDHFNQALALLPTNDQKNRSLFTIGKAKALLETGQDEEARKILTRLLKEDPDFEKINEAKEMLSKL